MRAVHIDANFDDFSGASVEVENEFTGTLFAVHAIADEFAVDAQLARAMWALDVIPAQRQFDKTVDFLERYKCWNLDAVGLKIGIEKRPAIAAMNELFRHFIAAFGAWSAGPRRHNFFLFLREIYSGGVRPRRTEDFTR